MPTPSGRHGTQLVIMRHGGRPRVVRLAAVVLRPSATGALDAREGMV